jgi:hypothetical protein
MPRLISSTWPGQPTGEARTRQTRPVGLPTEAPLGHRYARPGQFTTLSGSEVPMPWQTFA